MMKNRAGLLALAVLGIATLLMVFFIMPRLSETAKPIGETINEAGTAVKDAVTLGNDSASDILSEAARLTAEATEKVGRMVTGATESISSLSGLFANNTVPDKVRFAEARAATRTTLEELTKIEVPVTLDAATSALVEKARNAGTRTLDFLKAIPEDPSAAAAYVARLAAVFAGTDDGSLATATVPAAAAALTAPATPAAPAQETAAATENVVIPTFDVLRVEPDGSAVIAGKAEGGAKLEVLSSETPITATTVSPEGDFVAIPEQPLASGDHVLLLRATGASGKAVISEEIATVSVPREKNGQLLAMVSKPGEASRLLSLPQSPAAAETVAAEPVKAQAETAQAAVEAAAAPANSANATSGTAVTETASAPAAAADTASAAQAQAEIRINAVEFEGDRIFIAGSANPSANLRAFADDIAAGQGASEDTGRFIIEGKADLAPGPHSIRVETYDAAGKTLQQVTVPFNRPESEQAALVAQPQATASGDASAPQAGHAPLAQDDNAVIIRRGDTLWQISRRVYGRGVRYTTIYLANQDKIANPDRIEPGQTFTLPKEAVPNAEELHRKRLMGG